MKRFILIMSVAFFFFSATAHARPSKPQKRARVVALASGVLGAIATGSAPILVAVGAAALPVAVVPLGFAIAAIVTKHRAETLKGNPAK